MIALLAALRNLLPLRFRGGGWGGAVSRQQHQSEGTTPNPVLQRGVG